MTIPIMPGPFSFLQGAGQALGAFGEARTNEQHYQNALQLQQQQQALAGAAFLQKILTPEAFAQGGPGAAALGAAGLQAPSAGQIYTPPEVIRGQRLAQETKDIPVGTTESKMLAGAPLGSEVLGEEANKRVAGVLAQLTDEQIMNMRNIKSPGLARLLDQVETAKGRTALVQTATDTKEAKMRGDVYDAVMARLPNDPFFRKIASYAATGGAGVLSAQIEADARIAAERLGLNAADVRTLNNTMTIAAQEYRADAQSWDKGLQQAIRDRLGIDVSEIDRPEYVKKSNEVIKDYTDQHGKRPTPDLYMDYQLRKGGVSLPQFQGAYNQAMRIDEGGVTQDDLVPREGESKFDVAKRLFIAGKIKPEQIDAATIFTEKEKKEIKNSKVVGDLLTPKTDAGSSGVSNKSMQIKTKVPLGAVVP